MADDLKRVGIKITAEGAEDFKGSLKEISAVMKNNRAELKLAQSQYDKNTSVTQKLTDKQKFLTQQCQSYEDKLRILNAQLEIEKNKEDADAAAIQKKEAEIKEVQAQLNKYQGSLKDVNEQLTTHSAQLKEWGAQLKNIGDKVTGVGTTLTTHVTAPIMAVGAAGIAAFKEVDEAMDTVITKTGASGDALEDMQNRVKNLATSIPTDFATAGTAIGEVNTRFGLTGDALEDLSGKFIKFAQINGVDVNGSIDTVQAAMAAFGLSAEDAGNFLDVLNKAGQDTGVNVTKLAQDLTANSTALKELGFSAQDSAMFLANLDKSGINSSQVMSGLSKALVNAAKDGKPMNEALADLQKEMANAENDTAAMQKAMELFGNKAGPAIAKACSEGRLSFEDLGLSMDAFAGNVDETFEATLDPIDGFTTAANNAKVGLAELGEQIQIAAAPLIDELGEKIRQVTEWFTGLDDGQKQMIIRVATVAAAIGPLLLILGTVISTIGTIVGAVGTAMPVITGIATVLSGPVGLAIAGAVAAGIVLYKNWDTIKEKASEMAGAAKEKFEEMAGAAKEKFGEMQAAASEKFEALKASASEKFNAVQTIVTTAMGVAKEFVGARLSEMKAAYDEAGGGFQGAMSAAMTGIQNTFTEGYALLNQLTGGKLDEIVGVVKEKMEAFRAAISEKIDAAKQVVSEGIEKLKSYFNFEWKLPDLKLPHFSVSGEFSLRPPKVPSFSVDWYAKAMNNAMVLDTPTIFGMSGGSLLGAGEAGREVVSGEQHLMGMIREAVNEETNNFRNEVNITVYGAPGQDVRELAEIVADIVNGDIRSKAAAWA